MNRLLTLGFAAVPALLAARGEVGSLTVHADRPLHPMAKGFYGLMTEEINHSYDGGLYGELVRNRALKDDPARSVGWTTLAGGDATLDPEGVPGTALDRSLRIDGAGGVSNEGFWGIPVRSNTTYRASLYVKGDGIVTVELVRANDGTSLAKAETKAGKDWRKVTLTLATRTVLPSTANRLVIHTGGPGPVRVAGVSLFGPTVKDRPNGNRIDLMGLLAGMRPAFLRFPGGNYLEGDTIAERFDWKKTLGPIESRPGHQAPWGYRSSDGMGLLEFLLWCEDLGMKPLLAVYAGYSLRGEHVQPGPALEPYVRDALDEIEFVAGDARTTKWGAERARLGHPKPFPLETVEIGNEDWFDRSGSYDGRFAQFYDAIKAKDPKLRLIATAAVKARRPDLVDDHYYRTAAEMARDSDHYRKADRNGPKIFVGEWASLQGQPTPDFQAALGDAAWLTGLERDSDLVEMEAYAPLLTNLNPGASQWNTNLIGYDALRSVGSPSYWVQSMFAANQGETELAADVATTRAAEAFPYRGGVGVASSGAGAEFEDASVEGRRLPSLGAWALPPNWTFADGVLRQGVVGRPSRAVSIDPTWTDLTFHVRARRTGEGSVGVVFHDLDDHNLWTWTLGNGTNEIRHTEIFSTRSVAKGDAVALPVGDWADLRLEVRSGHVRGYVDGRLAIEADENPPAIPTLYASASRTGGETILKVVNLSATAATLRLDVTGAGGRWTVTGSSLSGPLWGLNTLDDPAAILPRPLAAKEMKPGDPYAFAPRSVTVLRLRSR